MERIADRNVEILVHATASSRGQDDARYRALTRAYLNFTPQSRQILEEEPPDHVIQHLDTKADNQLQDELRQSTQEVHESAASYQPDDEDEIGEGGSSEHHILDQLEISQLDSPILSFNSVMDNADSPAFRGTITCDKDVSGIRGNTYTQDSSDSWRPPPSTIADSQPEVDRPLLAFSSPTRVLQLILQNMESSEEGSSTASRLQEERGVEISPGNISNNHLGSSFESERMPSSPSPVKYSERLLQQILVNRSHECPSTQDADLGSKRKCAGSSPELSSSALVARVVETPLPDHNPARSPKRQRIEPMSSATNNKTEDIASSRLPRILNSSPPTNSVAAASSPTWSHSLEIRPNPPPTSSAELTPEMLITDKLHQLAEKIPAFIYCPKEQVRDLRPMERGYWRVDCQKWDDALRARCWNCLGISIGKQQVGWGVWCTRDEGYRTLRVYCWGIIVSHIYLLLNLSSERKIKGTGACWIGGDGEPVIKME